MEENKTNNVFGKLDEQGQKIDDISSKLEGVSIQDLYALAQRTWKSGDYITAQKYYNHISLLKPLEWKAPLYASLCNFHGYHDMVFWCNATPQLTDVYIGTIEFLISRDLPQSEKDKELIECFGIIKKELKGTKEHYFKYQNDYDNVNGEYVCVLEDSFFELYEYICKNNVKNLDDFGKFITSEFIEIARITGKLTSKVTEERFNHILDLAGESHDLNYESLIKSAKPEKAMSLQERQKIALEGKLYFEYTDKVISKRLFRRNLILGSIISIFAIGGIITSLYGSLLWIIPLSVMLFLGLTIIVKSFLEREKVSCASILSSNRKRTRLSSNGAIVIENSFPFYNLVAYILGYASGFSLLMFAVFSLTDKNMPKNICIMFACFSAVCVIALFLFIILRALNSANKKYFYLYNGKKYDRHE